MATGSEMLKLLDKQWATVHDIKKIGNVGFNKAQKIKKEIKENVEKDGKKLPYALVPMEKVVDYFNININYLRRVSK